MITKAHFKTIDPEEESEASSSEDMISSVDKINNQIRNGTIDGEKLFRCVSLVHIY